MITAPFAAFPDEDVDPKVKKEKEWILKMCRAVLYSYCQLPIGSIGMNSAPQYQKLRLYALGRQPIAPYKKLLQGNPDGNNPALVTDWAIRNIISTPRRNCIQIALKSPFDIQINPIDGLAKSELEEEYVSTKSKLMLRDMMKTRGMTEEMNLPVVRLDEGEAEDLEELESQQLGKRHQTAMDMEMLVKNALVSNDYDALNELATADYIDLGVSVMRDDSCDNKKIELSYIDPSFFIMSYCVKKDFSDWKYMGYVEPIQFSEIVSRSSGQVSKEDIERLWEVNRGAMSGYNLGIAGVVSEFSGWTYEQFYTRGQGYVLDVEFRSSDLKVLEERELPNGTSLYKRIDPTKIGKTKKNKYTKKYKENIYCAKWVVGTDILYDFGVKSNQKRDRRDDSIAMPSFHVQACDVNNMIARSRIESVVSAIDDYQMARYKMQNTLNTAIPSGWQVDLDALESVNLTIGGKRMENEALLSLFASRGVLVYRGKNLDGESNNKPAEFLQGGVGSEIVEFWNTMNDSKQYVKESLGLNDFTDSSTPNPKSLTTIAQAAMSGTNNALGDLFSAQIRMRRSLSRSIMIRCQDIVHYGNAEYIAYSLGDSTVMNLQSIKNIDRYIYSVEIADLPTPEDIQRFNEQLQVAQTNNELTIADILRLNGIRNLKQKEAFVVARVNKNREINRQQALELQQANADVQIQSSLKAEEAKQTTIDKQLQADIQRFNAEYEWKMKLEQMKQEYGLENQRIAGSGRVEAATVQAEAKVESTVITSQTKLLENGMPKQAEDIALPADLNSSIRPQTAENQPLEIQEFDMVG